MSWISQLDDRAVIGLSGPDAEAFLQGLITNDAREIGEASLLYAALLTPQGKILYDFLLSKRGDSILLDCDAAGAGALQKRLTLYRLRSKLDIAARNDLVVIASDDAIADAPADPRLGDLGFRAVMERAQAPAANDKGAYLARRLELGVPEGREFGQDRIFALDAGLEELHGISFSKGCYVGQELTARMKHRATARKRVLPVRAESGVLPDGEAPITADGREIGTLVSSYGASGFALVRLDRLAETGDGEMRIGAIRITIRRPSWLSA